MSNKIIIELQSKDNATGQIITSVKSLEGSLGGLEKTGAGAFAGLDTSISGSVVTLGKFAVAIGAASAALAGMAFKEAIKGIEDFNQKTINIASQLTNMAAEGQGSFKEMFERNLAHAKGFYDKLRGYDAERASSIEDMMQVYNSLVTQGYQVRMNEAEALSKITDLIKQKTAGQNFEIQAMQEIRSLLDGQANANSRIAQELKSRLGPAWADIVQSHREAGTLLDYLNSLYPGITASSERMQQTLEAQGTTLKSQLLYVGREGLQGAYDSIVGLASSINDYLKNNADNIIPKIAAAWRDIEKAVRNVYDILAMMPSVGLYEYFQRSLGEFKLFTAELKAAVQLVKGDWAGFSETRRQYKFDNLQVGKSLIGYGTESTGHVSAAEGIGQTTGKSLKDRYKGMDTEFMERFNAMAAAYKQATGKEIEITDAFRTFAQQAELYKKKPNLAARPGTSLHEKGLAMDINVAQANELAKMGLLEIYGFHRPMLGQGKSGKNEPWHIEMVDFKAQDKSRIDGIKEVEKALKDYEKQQERILNLETRHSRESVKESAKGAEEAKKMVESSRADLTKYADDRKRLDTEANDWSINALREAMQNESLTYDQRLTIGEQYKEKRIEQINAEIEARRKTYGERISEDIYASYQNAMVSQIDQQMKSVADAGSFQWEAAWNRAAENVEDAMGNMINNLLTQTKSGADMLKNLLQGFTQMFSQLAAQALMGLAKQGLSSMGGMSGIFGSLGGLFGGGGSYVGSAGGLIDEMLGGMSFALGNGGILPGNFIPIKAYGSGGIFSRPTIGVIGERGPEAVVPLHKYDERKNGGDVQIINVWDPAMVSQIAAQTIQSGAGRQIVLNIVNQDLAERGMTRRSVRR